MKNMNPQDIPASSIELINACNLSSLQRHVATTILCELEYLREQSLHSETMDYVNCEKLFATLIYDLTSGGK